MKKSFILLFLFLISSCLFSQTLLKDSWETIGNVSYVSFDGKNCIEIDSIKHGDGIYQLGVPIEQGVEYHIKFDYYIETYMNITNVNELLYNLRKENKNVFFQSNYFK